MELEDLRAKMDAVDEELCKLLTRRMEIAKEIGLWKRANGLPVEDAARESEKLEAITREAGADMEPVLEEVYLRLFARSRAVQKEILADSEFGLLGEKLCHSWSPPLHKLLGGYDYSLFAVPENELAEFLATTKCRGLNVTTPYKKAVVPYCHALTPAAKAIGSVNTMLRTAEGWLGDNPDYGGFFALVLALGGRPAGLHALVLGSGGAGVMAAQVLRDMGAAQVDIVSRNGRVNYETMNRSCDLIVNATPVGMYPNNGAAPIDLREFPKCRGVIDLIYNPLHTRLMLDAQRLGIPHISGLRMLAKQAAQAAELFLGKKLPPDNGAEDAMRRKMENLILIGMPGSGKTEIGRLLGQALSRPFYDTDAQITKRHGSIPEILKTEGEAAFREMETAAVQELGKNWSCVIATGGGVVMREENYDNLKQNGCLIWLKRPLDRLDTEGRPLSADLAALSALREPRYAAWADDMIENIGTPQETVKKILEAIS